jgi:hypothetical protein
MGVRISFVYNYQGFQDIGKRKLVLRSKSSSLVLALRRNTLSSWATIGINQVFIYAQLH